MNSLNPQVKDTKIEKVSSENIKVFSQVKVEKSSFRY